MSSVCSMESDIDHLIQQYKSKPAMVIAKLYLMSKTNKKHLLHVYNLLLQRLELLSETLSEDEADFQILHDLTLSLDTSVEKHELTILTAFSSLRKKSNIPTDKLHHILKATSTSTSSKGLIVRAFCSLMLGVKREAYRALSLIHI